MQLTLVVILLCIMRHSDYIPKFFCKAAGDGRSLQKTVGVESSKARTLSEPEAADNRGYFTSEQGEIRVVKAGPEFELLSVNPLDDYEWPLLRSRTER